MYNEKQHILDELNRQENLFLDEWERMSPIYNGNDWRLSKHYENITGAINHIEKCKELLFLTSY